MNFHIELLTLSCFVLVFTGINALDINLIAGVIIISKTAMQRGFIVLHTYAVNI